MDYPLASTTWGQEEIGAIYRIINSGTYTMGRYVREFEESFASQMGSKYCVMVNSGSSANLLAVSSLFFRSENRLKKGDEVVVPAVSWPTTYYPLQQYGLKLKFVDIDKYTLNYDLDKLREAVSDKTKMIMVVNLLGNPNDFDEINNIVSSRDIILMEDNCESMGATYNGRNTGTFGLLGTFSSFFSHHISTMEGGMIVVDDEEIYQILLSLRAHGWTRDLPKDNLVYGKKNPDKFYDLFNFVLPGYNLRPTEINGSIGIEQLKKLPDLIKTRRENASFFKEVFDNDNRFITQKEIGDSSWFGFSIVISPDCKFTRDKVVAELIHNKIDVRPIVAGNFVKNKVIDYFDYEISDSLNNSDLIDRNGFFVGNHHFDIKDRIQYLKDVIDRGF